MKKILALAAIVFWLASPASAGIILTETDTVSDHDPVNDTNLTTCLGGGTTFSQKKKATSGGTAGTVALSPSMGGSVQNFQFAYYESAAGEPNSTSWESGTWTVRTEITTANSNITWTQTTVCRINSSGLSQAQIGQLVGQTTSFGTTGVKTHSVTGNADAGAAATDKITLYLNSSNGSTMTQSFSFKPSQNIDTPVTQGGGGGGASSCNVPIGLMGVGC